MAPRSPSNSEQWAKFDWRSKGSNLFKMNRFSEAAKVYTLAIKKINGDQDLLKVLYTNRALCCLKLRKMDEAIKDARSALAIDSSQVKANYFLAKALIATQQHEKAYEHLLVAKEHAQNNGSSFSSEIDETLQYVFFKMRECQTQDEEIQLQIYVNELILRDIEFDQLVNERRRRTREDDSNSSNKKKSSEKKMRKFNEIFENMRENRINREVPDYFCDKITLEIMRDPVITPNGITYDRESIEKHLETSNMDPITRSDLKKTDLVPNLALREAIEDFLEQNEWARHLNFRV